MPVEQFQSTHPVFELSLSKPKEIAPSNALAIAFAATHGIDLSNTSIGDILKNLNISLTPAQLREILKAAQWNTHNPTLGMSRSTHLTFQEAKISNISIVPFLDTDDHTHQRKLMLAVSTEQPLQDPDTGIFNNTLFKILLPKTIGQAVRSGRPAGLLICSVYHSDKSHEFQLPNNNSPQNKPQEHCLSQTTRFGDMAFSIGNDQLAVVLPNILDAQGKNCLDIATRRYAAALQSCAEGTLCVGVAEFSPPVYEDTPTGKLARLTFSARDAADTFFSNADSIHFYAQKAAQENPRESPYMFRFNPEAHTGFTDLSADINPIDIPQQ